jgi:hypothetical protein
MPEEGGISGRSPNPSSCAAAAVIGSASRKRSNMHERRLSLEEISVTSLFLNMFLDLSLLYYLIIALLRVARNSRQQSFSTGKYHFSGRG